MNRTFLVIQREYLSRVRKKSFIIMTLLSPLLIALFYGLIFYFTLNRNIGESAKEILVVDQTGIFSNKLKGNDVIKFRFDDNQSDFTNIEKNISPELFGVLEISASQDSLKPIAKLFSKESASLSTISLIESQLNNELRNIELKKLGIDKSLISQVEKIKVDFQNAKINEEGSVNDSAEINTALGFICAFLIYMFIFLYGVQVMKGVIEEKTNRIVEVIISSVKPFELMIGKITGIALVGLTQFVLWILLAIVFIIPVSSFVIELTGFSATDISQLSSGQVKESGSAVWDIINQIDFVKILSLFLFYFLSGYLFYGALFAAVGSAVDSETDTQQFMLPITLPLIFSLVLAQSLVMNDPNGSVAFWLSVLPLTSPVVMMVRIPFGVPVYQLIISFVLMIAGIVFVVWLASRIYRIGILSYGKKPSYKQLWKWLFVKN